MIQVNNLSKNFYQGNQKIEALSDVSFSIEAQTTVSITGSSGSGKSTLLALMTGLDSVTRGEIQIFESSLSKMNEQELGAFRAKNFGIVFQQFHLMPHLTAFENVHLALEILGTPDKKKATSLLSDVGLTDRMKHFPHQLSGGEQQRVAIARALVTSPPILFADEPSGNLDGKTGDVITDLMFDLTLKNKSTLILITHDNELASKCKRQLRLNNGKLI